MKKSKIIENIPLGTFFIIIFQNKNFQIIFIVNKQYYNRIIAEKKL